MSSIATSIFRFFWELCTFSYDISTTVSCALLLMTLVGMVQHLLSYVRRLATAYLARSSAAVSTRAAFRSFSLDRSPHSAASSVTRSSDLCLPSSASFGFRR